MNCEPIICHQRIVSNNKLYKALLFYLYYKKQTSTYQPGKKLTPNDPFVIP